MSVTRTRMPLSCLGGKRDLIFNDNLVLLRRHSTCLDLSNQWVDTHLVESDVVLDVGCLGFGCGVIPGKCKKQARWTSPGDSPCNVLYALSVDVGGIIRSGTTRVHKRNPSRWSIITLSTGRRFCVGVA